MTLSELFARFRSDVDDLKDPFLWTNPDLESYFNWALERLAEVSFYFLDRSTWSALAITQDDPQIASTASNDLDKIIHIERALLASTNRTLEVVSMSQADESVRSEDDYGQRRWHLTSQSWENTTGVPGLLITDYYDDSSLRVGPIPNANDTVSLWAYRRPLFTVSLSQSGDIDLKNSAGIRENNDELALIEGMKVRAYLKEDPETRDTELALQSEARFQTNLINIKEQLMRKRRPPGKVRYGGL
jgi:hypothetical protein